MLLPLFSFIKVLLALRNAGQIIRVILNRGQKKKYKNVHLVSANALRAGLMFFCFHFL